MIHRRRTALHLRACCLLVCILLLGASRVRAADAEQPTRAKAKKPTADISATSASDAQQVGDEVRKALGTPLKGKKELTIVVRDKSPSSEAPAASRPRSARSQESSAERSPPLALSDLQIYSVTPQARAAADAPGGMAMPAMGTPTTGAPAADVHWGYDGPQGPQTWGQLRPDFNLCARGTRQSPIAIDSNTTLLGPAEPIQFNYGPSSGTVINNGHTIQVDVAGENAIAVRGSRYRLVQFHFHAPSEEQINGQRYPMVAHLVHRNDDGQLAVVAVLLQEGPPNPVIDKVWTYMPLDAADRVRMPRDALNLLALLPADQRYYQFMGSLTTPPCSEGVLWMVLKQPMSISRAQMRLFTQLYSHNARPLQPLNGRVVREAQ